MQFLYSILGFVLAIGILVTIHEFGHFWVARRVGVKVIRFSVGFGKPLKIWRRKNDDTEYVLAAIPLGGYVKMLDERVEEVPDSEKHQAFNRQSLAKRTAIVAAGPLANFLFAIIAMWGLYLVGMQDYPTVIGEIKPGSIAEQAGFRAGERIVAVDDKKVYGWQDSQLYLIHRTFQQKPVQFTLENPEDGSSRQLEVDLAGVESNAVSHGVLSQGLGIIPAPMNSSISDVVGGKPAQLAGLRAGDEIVKIDQTPITDWRELVETVSAAPGENVILAYRRDGQLYSTSMQIASIDIDGQHYGQIGVYPPRYRFSTGVFEGLAKAVDYTWRFTWVSLWSLTKMITRDVSTDNLSGPITIANLAGTTVQRGLADFVSFLVVISISLGLINLLPIPVLDGGHLMFFAIEAIKGSPVSERIMLWGQQIGIGLLLLLMSLAFYNDIIRLMS
jgi:regulator of sigma E protease